MSDYRIRVVSREEMARLRRSDELHGNAWLAHGMQRNYDDGDVLFVVRERSFDWECPGCGGILSGNLADEPVGGWEAPRWAIQNADPDHLTLAPSLGCSRWRTGECVGHWWARDGRLVLA